MSTDPYTYTILRQGQGYILRLRTGAGTYGLEEWQEGKDVARIDLDAELLLQVLDAVPLTLLRVAEGRRGGPDAVR